MAGGLTQTSHAPDARASTLNTGMPDRMIVKAIPVPSMPPEFPAQLPAAIRMALPGNQPTAKIHDTIASLTRPRCFERPTPRRAMPTTQIGVR